MAETWDVKSFSKLLVIFCCAIAYSIYVTAEFFRRCRLLERVLIEDHQKRILGLLSLVKVILKRSLVRYTLNNLDMSQ
jgi:hypothetical protein